MDLFVYSVFFQGKIEHNKEINKSALKSNSDSTPHTSWVTDEKNISEGCWNRRQILIGEVSNI